MILMPTRLTPYPMNFWLIHNYISSTFKFGAANHHHSLRLTPSVSYWQRRRFILNQKHDRGASCVTLFGAMIFCDDLLRACTTDDNDLTREFFLILFSEWVTQHVAFAHSILPHAHDIRPSGDGHMRPLDMGVFGSCFNPFFCPFMYFSFLLTCFFFQTYPLPLRFVGFDLNFSSPAVTHSRDCFLACHFLHFPIIPHLYDSICT